MTALPICFSLERQAACRALPRAWAKTGKRMAARMAIMAMTTSSSMRVNALLECGNRLDLCTRSSWRTVGATTRVTVHKRRAIFLPKKGATRSHNEHRSLSGRSERDHAAAGVTPAADELPDHP